MNLKFKNLLFYRAALLSVAFTLPLRAATNVVTTTADSGSGSLRDTIAASASGDVITFSNSLSGATIVLTSGELVLTNSLTIDASTLTNGIAIDGNAASRVFTVVSNTTVVLNLLTLTNGNASGSVGGGIYSLGTLTVNQCTLAGNYAGIHGGGIYNLGMLTVNQCTLTGNSAMFSGGGIYKFTGATLATVYVNQCTLTGNSAGSFGGGVYNNYSLQFPISLSNSIVAGNTAPTGPDYYGAVSGADNLTNGVPLLAPLADYGGPTPTMPPLDGSPAIDGCTNGTAFTTDQRGLPRIIGAYPDIGAVESGNAIPSYDYTVVTTTNDFLSEWTNNGVSLRSTLVFVPANATITFAPNLSGATILLTNGELVVNKSLTIDASTLPNGITINGNAASRIFNVASSSTDVLIGLTITNGYASGSSPADRGGGIFNQGTLTVNRCIISGNGASYGGGIYNDSGTLTVNQGTIASNSGTAYGGGIYNHPGTMTVNQSTIASNSCIQYGGGGILNWGALTVNESTIVGNSSTGNQGGGGISNYDYPLMVNQCTIVSNSDNYRGGGICNSLGQMMVNQCTIVGNLDNYGGGGIYSVGWQTLSNSIVAANPSGNILVYGPTTGSVNLTSGDPLLAPLGDYGGPTPTMPPLPGSPVIDGCINGTSFTTDQRGLPRIAGPFADIGAAENQVTVIVATNPPVLTGLTVLGNGTFGFAFTNLTGASFTVFASTNVALPMNLWSNLGPAVETPPASGQFQFTDSGATNYPQRFYRVRSP